MPDSPKIWGTLELETEGDRLQRCLQAPDLHLPRPQGGKKPVGGPGAMPYRACEHPALVGNRPINTSY